MNHEERVTSVIKLKTSMIRSNLCDYSDAYIHFKGTIKSQTLEHQQLQTIGKKIIFKNFAPFTNCISEINYTQVDDARDIDLVMPMYHLIRYNDIIQKHQEVYHNNIEMNQP